MRSGSKYYKGTGTRQCSVRDKRIGFDYIKASCKVQPSANRNKPRCTVVTVYLQEEETLEIVLGSLQVGSRVQVNLFCFILKGYTLRKWRLIVNLSGPKEAVLMMVFLQTYICSCTLLHQFR